jgi:hypothetical protein
MLAVSHSVDIVSKSTTPAQNLYGHKVWLKKRDVLGYIKIFIPMFAAIIIGGKHY